jgi:hypothetical protein
LPRVGGALSHAVPSIGYLQRHSQTVVCKTVVCKTSRIRGHQYSEVAQRLPISGEFRANGTLAPAEGRSQLNFQLAEYHGMIGEGDAVVRGRRSS